ncbi:FAD-dependent oxidoreductase [Amycolatopsis vastitatis]|nr:FAD-dependent oxidoreductase [Amycolatopsis vastitatis]
MSSETVTCCVVGGGPAGMMAALLLARRGVEVTVLEKHADFIRDFRGDTVHPSTLELLDELGLAGRFHQLPVKKAPMFRMLTEAGETRITDLREAGLPFPYIAYVPQWDFLTLLADEARQYPHFRLVTRAECTGLLQEDGHVTGVRYRTPDGDHELRARLTVAADGRHSTVRRAAGLRARDLGAPMDVVSFRLPREEDDGDQPFLRLGTGHLIIGINRGSYWQLGYLIPKKGYRVLEAAGIGELHRRIDGLLPAFAERMRSIGSFRDTSVLEVQLNRLTRWHRPGLLVIGDAAHAMSPVGGVGINLAVQDAVAAVNILGTALRRSQYSGSSLDDSLLGQVQRRRTPPTVATQLFQRAIQARLIRPALTGSQAAVPLPLRLMSRFKPSRVAFSRFVAQGFRPEHVRA